MLTPSWINDGSEIADPLGYGERAVHWLRRLKHPKNPAKGHPFQLDDWQERIIRAIYGPRNDDGTRIVRRVVLVLPRGGRKTSLCAALVLLHLFGPERLRGGLTVSAASAHEQARELFQEAALIVEGDKRMWQHLTVRDYTSSITFGAERSRYIAVASDGKVQHGKTPNVVIADELHAWEGAAGRRQWEALDSALVKVPNTLLVVATTSGRGQDNLAWQTVEYAIKVQKGEIDDPATLPVVFMAEKDDDWKDEAVWHAVNPGMKHGYPDLASYRDKAKKAIASPPDRDSFLQYNLNVWLDRSTSPFVDMAIYDQGAAPIDMAALAGAPCWLGVDLGITDDLTAVVAAFRDPEVDGGYIVVPHFFTPADNVDKRTATSGFPYRRYVKDGDIVATPGNVTDFAAVEAKIRALCASYDVQEVAFDPAYGAQMMQSLEADGFPVVAFRQGWFSMAPAVRELERAIIAGRFRHGGHPVLRWNFANIAVETDKAGNRFFNKSKSTEKIDGAVATTMAVSRASIGNTGTSIYNDPTARPNGLIII
jgi:phage terminase large subunit-like protein